MKLLFDFLPIILFFAAYRIAGSNESGALEMLAPWLGDGIVAAQAPLLIATAVAIATTGAQVTWSLLRHRKVDTTLWVSFALILLFGGATLAFHDATFIKWKPTVLYWSFAFVLTISALLFRVNLLRRMLAAQVRLPEPVWQQLNFAWVGFFALMGVLNLYVAFNHSEQVWVNYRLFGGMGLTLVFLLGQGFYLSRFIQEEPS